jgi:hypothetical protein
MIRYDTYHFHAFELENSSEHEREHSGADDPLVGEAAIEDRGSAVS